MVAVAAAPYGVLFFASCGFLTYLADRVQEGGVAELARGWLLPTTAMLVLLAIGAIGGVLSAVRQVAATRRLADHIAAATVADPVGAPDGVEVIDHPDAFGFTFGLGSPRIALSRGLIERLSPAELDAVLAHERYHLAARDPLKLLIARVAARTCFFLPAAGHLVARYAAGRELAADRRALRAGGQAALAGALFKVVAGPGWDELDTAAAMAGPELLAVRVDQVESGSEPSLPTVPTAALVASAAVLVTLITVVAAVALQGGLSMSMSTSMSMSGGDNAALPASDVAMAVASGVACSAGWVWLAVVAFRRLVRPALTTTGS